MVKMSIVIAAVCLAMSAGPLWAQAAPQTPPAGEKPAAQTPAAAQPPAVQPQPPKPFPEGAKVAFVNINIIAQQSAEGKAATGKIQDYVKKKNAEIQEKQKTIQTLQGKLSQGASVMSDQARNALEKDITKQNRELQIAQEDAQQEQQQLTQELQNEFQQKLFPVIDAIATEKGLHMVFSIADAGIVWPHAGLDLTTEVIKRFDAIAKPGTTKK
jgi:outer membrane protein